MRAALMAGAVALVLGSASSASAEDTATFEVTYKQVASDCNGKGLKLEKGTAVLTQLDGPNIRVELSGVPDMKGTRGRRGKFKARATGPVSGGITARFKASGKVKTKSVDLMLIAELYRGKETVCTQSWWATGTRK